MKRLLLSGALTIAATALIGQSAVNYGPSTGTSGSGNSFFGHYTGNAVTGRQNTSMGAWSMRSATSGNHNVAIGYNSLYSNKGSYNVAVGSSALNYNDQTNDNVAVGYNALNFAESSNNTAVGSRSMYGGSGVSTGYQNSALGGRTLYKNKTGYQNVAVGYTALYNNYSGILNSAMGFEALYSNTSGNSNSATGYKSMHANTTGHSNSAMGNKSLWRNTSGHSNVAVGWEANNDNTTGNYNTGCGLRAMRYNTTGNYNTGLGAYAGPSSTSTNLTYATAIGYYASNTASNQVRVGASWMSSIGGYQAWTNLSDGRFKNDVQENVQGLKFINALRPVSYKVDRQAVNNFLGIELDEETRASLPADHYETGFIAQEVEATAQKLGFDQFHGVDAPQNENDHYGLRYSEFVVPLVKSVQELSTQNEEQQATIQAQQTSIEELKAMVAQQQAQIEQLLQARTLHSTAPSTIQGARLGQNIPNPFHTETTIQVEVPASAHHAFLQVSTLEGKQLWVQPIEERGASTVTLAGRQLPAGIYLYTLVVDDQLIDSKRMVLTQ